MCAPNCSVCPILPSCCTASIGNVRLTRALRLHGLFSIPYSCSLKGNASRTRQQRQAAASRAILPYACRRVDSVAPSSLILLLSSVAVSTAGAVNARAVDFYRNRGICVCYSDDYGTDDDCDDDDKLPVLFVSVCSGLQRFHRK